MKTYWNRVGHCLRNDFSKGVLGRISLVELDELGRAIFGIFAGILIGLILPLVLMGRPIVYVFRSLYLPLKYGAKIDDKLGEV